MTLELRTDQVILIHDRLVCAAPLIDLGKLEGALAAPFQTPFGHDPYPTVVQKAAKLLEGISRAHAFLDGNKRTAWLSCVTFLDLNGMPVMALAAMDAADGVVQIATLRESKAALQDTEIEVISEWLADHLG